MLDKTYVIFYRNFFVIEFETKVRLRVGNSDLWRRRFAVLVWGDGVWWGSLLGNITLKNNVYGKIELSV